ncbi:MAG: protein phosphatase [Kofleriaceae bacterium]|nr:protein phosphatase [Kofleriaceae bacterium]
MIDLDWITTDLAVGGSFPNAAVEVLARDHTVAAVIDVRLEAHDDEQILRAHGLSLLHLPTADHCAVAPGMLEDGVAFAARHHEVGGRVLIHCEHGIGRSALVALCVLVDRGHEPLAALALAKDRRAQVSPSPAQYEAWVGWLLARGAAPPTFAEFAAIAYRHLKG